MAKVIWRKATSLVCKTSLVGNFCRIRRVANLSWCVDLGMNVFLGGLASVHVCP